MDHDHVDIESWLYEANGDLDDATAAEIDVEAALAQVKQRVVNDTAEFAVALSSELTPDEPQLSQTAAHASDRFPFAAAAYSAPTPARLGGIVRPYLRTGGRTRPNYDLAIEALVSTSELGKNHHEDMQYEHRVICGLCLDTRSVAEVAAHLMVPIGTARVLIGDMAGMGLVLVHHPPERRPSFDLLERVLDGLANLSPTSSTNEPHPVDYEADAPTAPLPTYEAMPSQPFEARGSKDSEPHAKQPVLPSEPSPSVPPSPPNRHRMAAGWLAAARAGARAGAAVGENLTQRSQPKHAEGLPVDDLVKRSQREHEE